MNVSLHSIFDAPIHRETLTEGITLGRNWHFSSDPIWSCDRTCTLTVENATYPEPKRLALQFAVFNASPENPKTLRIESPGHAPVELTVTSGAPHFVDLFSPVHAAGAAVSEIGLQLDGIDSPAKLRQSADDRLLGLRILTLAPRLPEQAFPLDFSDKDVCAACLDDNWATPDSTGTWSIGPKARIVLPGYLQVEGGALLIDWAILPRSGDLAPLEVAVDINGQRLLNWTGPEGEDAPRICPLPQGWQPGQDLEIALTLDNLLSPLDLGINIDPRPLGIMLRSIASTNML